jgi:alkylation response protein AidB-like acyl-CoA dehydrogenase
VDFGLSPEQRLLEQALRRLLDERMPPARVREVAAAPDAFDPALWKALAEQGVLGVLVPEAHGGAGLALLDAALAATELGRAAAPGPFLASAVMAPVALAAASPAEQAEWLPRLAAGEARFGVAATETWARRDGAGVRVEEGRLSGTSLFAVDAPGADALLVAAGADSLALVDAHAPGVAVADLPTLDRTRRVGEVTLDGAAPAGWIGGRGGAAAVVERMLDAGRAAVAADALGACDRALELSVAYAGERRQFGRPIGSFQAVKHLLAEMAAEIEPARSLVWYAAHAFDALPEEAPLAVAHAKAHLGEVGRDVVRTATEVHGGVGFTDAHDLQLWFKRAHLDRVLLGAPDVLRARAARLQWGDALAG